MPKMTDTRRQRVKRLLERVVDGPYIVAGPPFSTFTPEQIQEIKKHYKLWSESWIVPEIQDLLKHDLEGK